MSTGRFLAGTLAGAVVMFFMGFVLYDLLFGAFFEANQGSVVGLMRESPVWVYLILGQLVYGALLTVVIGKWIGRSGAAAGLQIGAVLGLLFGFGLDLTLFGVSNMANLTATLVDPFIMAVQMGLAGAAVGAALAAVK
jgi:hypothetical protein